MTTYTDNLQITNKNNYSGIYNYFNSIVKRVKLFRAIITKQSERFYKGLTNFLIACSTNLNETQGQVLESFNVPQYPAKYFLSLKSSDHDKWKERWECMLWELKDSYAHLPFDSFPISDPSDRGKFFRLVGCDDDKNVEKMSVTEVDNSSMWVFPGALGTSRHQIKNVLLDVNKALSKIKKDSQIDLAEPIIFCPHDTGEERYKEAMYYGKDKGNYYSAAVEKLVRTYLLPRIINEKTTIILTHSVGGREVSMAENVARYILREEYAYSESLIEQLFQNITAVCIGHASDIEGLPKPRFKKISVLSASDQGLLIPRSLYRRIYTPAFCNRPFSLFNIDKYESIFFYGHQSSVEVLDNKINLDGHRLAHYFQTIINFTPLSVYNCFLKSMFSNNISSDLKGWESCLESL